MAKATKRKEFSQKLPHWMFGVTYACVILSILLVGAKFALHGAIYRSLFMDTTYQAVTLSNGQTFFGQLNQYGPSTFVLEDVYYLQTAAVTETTVDAADGTTPTEGASNSGIELVKLVDDVHKPMNHIVLNSDQIVYWQNLSQASPIMEAIVNSYNETE